MGDGTGGEGGPIAAGGGGGHLGAVGLGCARPGGARASRRRRETEGRKLLGRTLGFNCSSVEASWALSPCPEEQSTLCAMEGGSSMQANYVFRGIEYIVTMMVTGDVLEVEVEDRLTSEQWRGEFEAVYIEDVTHKTGNFKQFSIFCNMLESAITKSSESVTLDLLTYSDLELLRNRKAGVAMRHGPPPKSGALNAKRYLILIYSVEFD
ncbi:centrosomal protein CCDC61-like, partial [Mustelus asterias]